MKKIKTHQSRRLKWKFHRVSDTRGNPIPNLWQRNNRFYAQLTLKEHDRTKNTKRPLKAVSLSEAKAEIEELREGPPFNIACGVWWCKREGEDIIIVSSEIKPRVRSAKVWRFTMAK